LNRFFWGTILLLAAVTIVLGVIGTAGKATPPAEIEPARLESILSATARETHRAIEPRIPLLLDALYAPVYAAIPAYTDFHYSVLGEYTELTASALSQASDKLHGLLFAGFDERQHELVATLDREFAATYSTLLQENLAAALPSDKLNLGPVTETVTASMRNRVSISYPLAVALVSAKPLATAVAKKIGLKIAARTTGKLALATGGASAGLACGPLAPLCAVAAGIATWFLVDVAAVNLDEYWNRDEFETDVRAMIDDDKTTKRRLLESALREKAAQLDAAAKAVIADFTLQNL
jgi:hypothetical protein